MTSSGGTHARSRHPILKALGICVALAFLVSGTISALSSNASTTGHASQPPVSQPQPVASTSTSPESTPAVTAVRTVRRIVFKAWGHAQSGADITYGSDSDSRSPRGGLGLDGTGTAVPWHASMKYRPGALYYDVSAQLNGAGDIKCSVTARVTVFYSDGTHATRHKRLAVGHASGQYQICQAETS